MGEFLTNPIALGAFICGAVAIYLVIMRTLKKREE